MKCYECGKAEMAAILGVHEYDVAGLPYPVVLVGVPIERCPGCGEETVTIPDPEGLHRLLALNIVEASRPLLPQEFRFLRKLLDKSAEDMASLMGVDAKTLSRWENGKQKMGKVAERLLRLLIHQKLAPTAVTFAEDVFPRLHDEGEAESMKLRVCPRINALKLQGGAPPARSWNPKLYLDTARFRGRVGGDASAANSVRLFSYRP